MEQKVLAIFYLVYLTWPGMRLLSTDLGCFQVISPLDGTTVSKLFIFILLFSYLPF